MYVVVRTYLLMNFKANDDTSIDTYDSVNVSTTVNCQSDLEAGWFTLLSIP